MEIRLVNAEHLEEIFHIYAACKRAMEKENIFQWTTHYPNISHIEDDIKNRHLYGLADQGKYLGVICLDSQQDEQYKIIPWEDLHGKSLVIHRFAVDPLYQHLGLGRKLMDFAEDEAKKEKYTSIRFDAYSGNERTLKLYNNRGYLNRGEIYFPGRELPFYCYEKLI